MRKLNIVILLGLVVALLGAALVYVAGQRVEERVAAGRESVTVFVARNTLTEGTRGSDLDVGTDLDEQKVPRAFIPEGAITDLAAVADQVLLGPVPKGSALAGAMFGAPTETAAVRPAAGRLALAVGVDITPGVARYLAPGSVVDVFVTYPGGVGDRAALRTKLFVSGVKVLSVTVAPPPATRTEDDEESADPAFTGDQAEQVVAVLDVTPAQAEQVVNATTLGRLYLALSAVEGNGQQHRTQQGVIPDDVVSANR